MIKIVFVENQEEGVVVYLPQDKGEFVTTDHAKVCYEIDGDLVRLKTDEFLWDVHDISQFIDFLKAVQEQLKKADQE
jgi:hypothetical protein